MKQYFTQGRINEALDLKVKLDVKDQKILTMLSQDGRMPVSTIAKQVRMSRDGVSYRIHRLIKKGVIIGFLPKINLQCFGYDTYHVFMMIQSLNKERKQELIDTLTEHPNTISLIEYHDSWDLEWVMCAKNLRIFDSKVIGVTKDFTDLIVRKDKLTIIKGLKSIQLPGTIFKDNAYFTKIKSPTRGIVKLDKVDIKILRILAKNARLSNFEIANHLKLSHDAVRYRINKMLRSGVIYGFTVLVNLSSLDYHWYTFCINVRTFALNYELKFREFISQNPFVLRAVKVLGDWDLLLYITAEKRELFHTTFKQIQKHFIDIIIDYQTWLAYKEHAYTSFPKVVDEK